MAATVLILAYVTMALTWGRADYQGIASVLIQNCWQPSEDLIYFGPAPHGLLTPVGLYLPGRPVLAQPRSRARSCSTPVFLVSYDRFAGPRWFHEHRSQVWTVNTFAAYDHSPLGPRASKPIFVARLRKTPGLCEDAVRHGGLIFAAARK